jgi:AcrR family transcriptional regulator
MRWCCFDGEAAAQKGSAAAMTRPPSGPDAGADDDDPPVAAARRDNGQLSRSMILQTALAIVDRDGVDGLSMRRLSDAVGRDPVMLYRHVPNKAAVLDGVAEIVLAQLPVDNTDPDWAGQLRTVAHHFRHLALTHPNVVPLLVTRPLATPLGQRPPGMLRPLEDVLAQLSVNTADPDWVGQLRTVARAFRELALTHPNVVPLMVTRPLATPLGQRPPGMLRPLEDVLALLTSAGFTGDDALHIYRVLFGFLYGHILHELQEVIERPEETDHVLRLGLHRLAITEFPVLRALAPALASYDGAADLDRGLDVLLPGLTATLTHPDESPRSV